MRKAKFVYLISGVLMITGGVTSVILLMRYIDKYLNFFEDDYML